MLLDIGGSLFWWHALELLVGFNVVTAFADDAFMSFSGGPGEACRRRGLVSFLGLLWGWRRESCGAARRSPMILSPSHF